MLPLIITAIVVVGVVALVALYRGPTKDNSTINTVESRLQHEEEIAERKRKNYQDAEEIKQGKKRVQEMEARSQRREAELTRMMQQVEIREQRAKVNRKVQDEDKRKRKKGEKRAAREKNEEESRETAAGGGSEEEARELERELKVGEKRLEEEVEKVNRMEEIQCAARVAEDGFGPLRWPTRGELQQALGATEYNPKNFHFAIVGRAGSGKSSLLNAFRNLRNIDLGAAPTGTTETTLEVKRYKDPEDQPPRQWMVWFDVPGAGTQRIPHHDYFIKQGLFVFDFIILAIGDRFEEIDVCILENCKRFKIPAFIVRSKADMHILNSMKEYEDCKSINDNPSLYKECRNRFIADTQKSVSDGLKLQGLPDQDVYIVSRDELQWAYNTSLQFSGDLLALMDTGMRLIHESQLAKELLTVAVQRRCDIKEQAINWARAKYSTVLEYYASRLHQEIQPPRAIPHMVQDTQQHDIHQDTPAREVTPRVAGAAGSMGSTGHKSVQEVASSNPEKRKVIYLPQETSAQELYDEMTQHDLELPSKIIGPPCMFTPRVAMLTFYPFASIPSHIYAFGSQLRVEEYKEKKQQGKKSVGSTHTHVDEASVGYQSNSASTRGNANRGRGGRGRARGQVKR